MTASWVASRFTGILHPGGDIPPLPHDPEVWMRGDLLAPSVPWIRPLAVGGAGWSIEAARAASAGEAIERLEPYATRVDGSVVSSFDRWPLEEPAMPPEVWVLFHPEQYAQPGFPFEPFRRSTECRWVVFRDVRTGGAVWIPEEMGFLFSRAGEPHRLAPAVSTGLAAGVVEVGAPDRLLLRGVQEAIERDAVLGAWWGRYALEEWPEEEAFALLGPEVTGRLRRPNLRYRFYRAATPFSAHATLVTLEGEDRAGRIFSAGSACRETRRASWEKSALEAVQGRHYVRHLLQESPAPRPARPASFAAHALHFTLHPDRLAATAFSSPAAPDRYSDTPEGLRDLLNRLGADRRVLFRNMTPAVAASPDSSGGWLVVRVVIPGLQPLHGEDAFAHLGGPLWAPRGLADWHRTEPHPFA